MKLINYIPMIAAAALFSSCSITLPVTATNNPNAGKVGVATNNCLFMAPPKIGGTGFFPVSGGFCFNDKKYGIAEAARNGGINKVATVDLKVTDYIIFSKYELIVTGE